MHPLHANITDWIGAACPVDFLNVWFPAHWAPIVLQELQRREQQSRREHALWFDAPAHYSDNNKLIKERVGWTLHGSTRFVVRAVALLSAKHSEKESSMMIV